MTLIYYSTLTIYFLTIADGCNLWMVNRPQYEHVAWTQSVLRKLLKCVVFPKFYTLLKVT